VAKLALVVVALVALTLGVASSSRADKRQLPCGLPESGGTAWIDYAWPTYAPIFARKGVILATGSGAFPAQMRAAGAGTVHWDMNLKARVGTPNVPIDPTTIVGRANKLFDYAVAQTGCSTPLIAENELFGANLVTPWSDTTRQYRDNVLVYLKTLAERGARPFLLVNTRPYLGGEAADWWREVSKYTDIVREVYPSAKVLYRQGPILANRTLRVSMRRGIVDFTEIGIPTSKLGVMLGFHKGRSSAGGRAGLQPASAWFRVAKWQALSAKAIAKETDLASVWSWGWGEWTEADRDPDRNGAACVWLWVRSPSLCDGPTKAGPDFDASLTEGQVVLPSGAKCVVGETPLRMSDISRLQKVTGDREIAVGALLARAAESRSTTSVSAKDVRAAERAVIAAHFGGSAVAYRRALAAAGATPEVARGVLADVIRHVQIERTLRVGPPSGAAVSTFYRSYPELVVRPVVVDPAPSWLGWRTQGFALASFAPSKVMSLPTVKAAKPQPAKAKPGTAKRKKPKAEPPNVRSVEGSFSVRATGPPQALATLPLASVSRSIASVLQVFARRVAFDNWTTVRQVDALRSTICRRDDLPVPTAIELTDYLPFLSATG
jgi:hypothetical protein